MILSMDNIEQAINYHVNLARVSRTVARILTEKDADIIEIHPATEQEEQSEAEIIPLRRKA